VHGGGCLLVGAPRLLAHHAAAAAGAGGAPQGVVDARAAGATVAGGRGDDDVYKPVWPSGLWATSQGSHQEFSSVGCGLWATSQGSHQVSHALRGEGASVGETARINLLKGGADWSDTLLGGNSVVENCVTHVYTCSTIVMLVCIYSRQLCSSRVYVVNHCVSEKLYGRRVSAIGGTPFGRTSILGDIVRSNIWCTHKAVCSAKCTCTRLATDPHLCVVSLSPSNSKSSPTCRLQNPPPATRLCPHILGPSTSLLPLPPAPRRHWSIVNTTSLPATPRWVSSLFLATLVSLLETQSRRRPSGRRPNGSRGGPYPPHRQRRRW
jgi:hypothetical protein